MCNCRRGGTHILLLGALEDALVVIIIDGIGDADGGTDDTDAAEDAAGGRGSKGEDCFQVLDRCLS